MDFYVQSGRCYEALAAADAATLQPPPPPTPTQAAGQKRKLEESELPQVVMLPAVWFPDPQLSAKTVKSGDMEMACKLDRKEDNPLTSRTSILTVDCIYDMFDKNLAPTLPPLLEVYAAQGCGWRVGWQAASMPAASTCRRSGHTSTSSAEAAWQGIRQLKLHSRSTRIGGVYAVAMAV